MNDFFEIGEVVTIYAGDYENEGKITLINEHGIMIRSTLTDHYVAYPWTSVISIVAK